LHQAIAQGHLDTVMLLLAQDGSLVHQEYFTLADKARLSPLSLAAATGNVEMVKYLHVTGGQLVESNATMEFDGDGGKVEEVESLGVLTVAQQLGHSGVAFYVLQEQEQSSRWSDMMLLVSQKHGSSYSSSSSSRPSSLTYESLVPSLPPLLLKVKQQQSLQSPAGQDMTTSMLEVKTKKLVQFSELSQQVLLKTEEQLVVHQKTKSQLVAECKSLQQQFQQQQQQQQQVRPYSSSNASLFSPEGEIAQLSVTEKRLNELLSQITQLDGEERQLNAKRDFLESQQHSVEEEKAALLTQQKLLSEERFQMRRQESLLQHEEEAMRLQYEENVAAKASFSEKEAMNSAVPHSPDTS
jgi:hypothetical protein